MNSGPNDVGAAARAYAANGWALIEFPRGTKGPVTHGWNLPQNQTTDPAEAGLFTGNLGLCHASSGTCVLDVDDVGLAAPWLEAHGLSLEALRAEPLRVGISSGREGRAKLLYRLPAGVAPLPSKRPPGSGIELRCATAGGLTVQDVLPPSIHPVTNKPYVWEYGDEQAGHWSALPELPQSLLDLWRSLMAAPPAQRQAPRGVAAERIRGMLSRLDPDLDYNEWVKVGMALHHEAEGEDWGLALWDEWSEKGTKYPGAESLHPHWRSFGGDRGRAVTIQSIIGMAGGVNPDDFDDLSGSEERRDIDLGKPDRLAAIEWDEFMSGPDPEFLVQNLIGKRALSMIYGESTAGKTYLAVALAVAVAGGQPWCERQIQGGKVIYVVNEGVAGLRGRMRAAVQAQGLDEAIIRDRISFITGVPSLRTDPDVKRLIKEVQRTDAVLIVIDTLSHSISGADENSAEAMSEVVRRCIHITCETAATVLLVHHAGKDAGRGARGSSALKAAVDNEISVEATPSQDSKRVRVTKMKDGEGAGNEFCMTFVSTDLGPNAQGDARRASAVILEPARDGTAFAQAKPKKLGGIQKTVLDVVCKLSGVVGESVAVETVVEQCLEKIFPPPAEKRDQRRAHIMRAIQGLCDEGRFIEKDGDRVMLR